MLAALFVGGAVIPRVTFDPHAVLRGIERHRASEVLFVPTMTIAVVEEAARSHHDLSSLESVFSAAAPAPIWLWERVRSDLGAGKIFTG